MIWNVYIPAIFLECKTERLKYFLNSAQFRNILWIPENCLNVIIIYNLIYFKIALAA